MVGSDRQRCIAFTAECLHISAAGTQQRRRALGSVVRGSCVQRAAAAGAARLLGRACAQQQASAGHMPLVNGGFQRRPAVDIGGIGRAPRFQQGRQAAGVPKLGGQEDCSSARGLRLGFKVRACKA